jgi:hypothetical protein
MDVPINTLIDPSACDVSFALDVSPPVCTLRLRCVNAKTHASADMFFKVLTRVHPSFRLFAVSLFKSRRHGYGGSLSGMGDGQRSVSELSET